VRAVKWLTVVVSLALVPPLRTAAGTIPADDAVVLAVLPTALVRHREASSGVSNPAHDVDATLRLVRLYLDADADSGDARYLDRAEGLLEAWPVRAPRELPTAILLAHAEIAQRAHRFDEARAALGDLLGREPDHGQAHLMRAYVLIAQGDSRAALEDCDRLRVVSAIDAVNCACRVRGLTGEAGRAYTDVVDALKRARRAAMSGEAGLREFSLTAADLAERLGLTENARAHYRLALAIAPNSAFTQSAYADFLLEERDAAAAHALIAADDERLGLQVRRAIAAKRLGRADAQTLAEALMARFVLIQLRGDTLATREYARFALDVMGDAPTALGAALGNWRVQREPEDALLVLRAARAAQNRRAALPVSHWVAATHLEDVRLPDLDFGWSR
jgi:Tfp pilus assembly protein PilF